MRGNVSKTNGKQMKKKTEENLGLDDIQLRVDGPQDTSQEIIDMAKVMGFSGFGEKSPVTMIIKCSGRPSQSVRYISNICIRLILKYLRF